MFDVGFWEVTLIAVVALLVVGPERLPDLARTVGRYVGKARRYADHVRREIEREVPTREIREALNNPPEQVAEIKSALEETRSSLGEAGKTLGQVKEELGRPVGSEDDSGTGSQLSAGSEERLPAPETGEPGSPGAAEPQTTTERRE